MILFRQAAFFERVLLERAMWEDVQVVMLWLRPRASSRLSLSSILFRSVGYPGCYSCDLFRAQRRAINCNPGRSLLFRPTVLL